MNFIMHIAPRQLVKYCNCPTTLDTLRGGEKIMRHFCLISILAIAFGAVLTNRPMAGEASYSSARSAAELYTKHCASCHGKDGRAKTFKAKLNHARDLTDPVWQDRASDERLFNTIMKGKEKK